MKWTQQIIENIWVQDSIVVLLNPRTGLIEGYIHRIPVGM